MLKYIALALVFLACGGTGAFLSRGLTLRARELELCLQMIASFSAQLQFSRPPLERMLAEVCGQTRRPAFLPKCLEAMRAGTDFPAAWRAALQSTGLGLKEDDRRQLLGLGELLGAGDAAGQREALQLQESLLNARLEQVRAQRDSRGKAYFTLGILAGLSLMILFM